MTDFYSILKKDVEDVRSDMKGLASLMNEIRADVSGAVDKIDGQERGLTEMLSIVKKTADLVADQQHASFAASVEVARAKALAAVEIDKEQQLDTLDAQKTRRALFLRGIGLVASGGGVIELLHRLGVL